MNNTIHIYRQKHIFAGDELIGTYELRRRTYTLLPGRENHRDAVRAHFIRSQGILARLVSTDGGAICPERPMTEFPPAILAQKDILLGDLTPALVAYAREHFPPEEFDLRYAGRVDPPAPISPDFAALDFTPPASAPVSTPAATPARQAAPGRKRASRKKTGG